MPRAIAVGGSKGSGISEVDQRWDDGPDYVNNPGSNYGPEIDVFAPARDIRSAFWKETSPGVFPPRSRATSGTSFAAPLVTGMAARYLSDGPSETPQMISDRIVNGATTPALAPDQATANNFLSNALGSPRRLLFTPIGCRVR